MIPLYNLCIMVCLKYTPHTKYDIRCGAVRVGHLETLSQCATKLSQGAPKVSQGAPTFLKAHIVTATSSISQLQALATGICSIQILIFVISTLSSGT